MTEPDPMTEPWDGLYTRYRAAGRAKCSRWGLARCSLSADSCTWHALLFGGDPLAGRLAALWKQHIGVTRGPLSPGTR